MSDNDDLEETALFRNEHAISFNDLRPIDCSRRTSDVSRVSMVKSFSNVFRPSTSARMQYGVDTSFKSRLQQYFIENHRTSFRIRLFNLFIKVLSCVLYCVRVIYDNGELPDHVSLPDRPEGSIKYEYLYWVDTPTYLWLAQTVVAIISLIETILIFYISYKGNVWRLLLNIHFLLEMITSFPLILTIFLPHLRQLYVPVFLNCWLAKSALQAMLNDLNRVSIMNQSALFRQMVILFSILLCLIFTGMCGIEHLQRGGERQFDLFTSFYFIMVTFSTVGYGDWYPDTWMSRLLVVVLICVALGVLPQQIEALGQTWLEKQKSGGDIATGWSKVETHIVVTITHLEVEFIKDFLTEFYAHPENQRILCILLSPSELDNQTRMLLKIPMWSSRVKYVRGSALRDEDLERSRVATAKACFILSARHVQRKILTDEHTILRSWAVKDFAPHVPQYVQVFRPETKMHLDHAEVCICEDELKYSLLANNCVCPGISTFLTLLMHTSRGEEGQKSTEPWHKVYGFHSGNEIYDIVVENSKFFGDFVGKSFTYASFHAHRSYGIGLIGVKTNEPHAKIRLNPGLTHTIQLSDTLYYMGLTNEESLYDFRKDLKDQRMKATVASSIANVAANSSIEINFGEEGESTRLLSNDSHGESDYENLLKAVPDSISNDLSDITDISFSKRPSRIETNSGTVCIKIGAVAMDVPHLDGQQKKEKKKRRGLLKKSSKANDEVSLIQVQPDSDRRPSIALVTESHDDTSSSDSDDEKNCDKCGDGVCIQSLTHTNKTIMNILSEKHVLERLCIKKLVHRTYPKVRTYIGASPTVCHMLKQKREICCLQIDKACEHCPYTAAHEYGWKNSAIILAADKTSSGMYNLIIPLRAYYRPVHELRPIVLLLELEDSDTPNPAFLDAVSYFPMIYWIQGKISNLDNLLKAGVCQAENVVVVKEAATIAEEHFADCSTIITVQKIHRMFPNLRLVTELTHTSNMRFMMFNPHDPYSLQQSKFEKKERKRGSNMPYMFRLPFAQGGVFSANMLDRLLYQSIIKPYLVSLTRILLGIDQSPGSGYLASFVITEEDLWIKNYGRLYQKLCSSVADIPIGIFRTKGMDKKTVSIDMAEEHQYCSVDSELTQRNRRREMQDMVTNQMRFMGMTQESENVENKDSLISFVIINPSSDLVLEAGDIVYVLRGPVKEDARNKKVNPRRGLRRARQVTESHEPPTILRPSIPRLVVT